MKLTTLFTLLSTGLVSFTLGKKGYDQPLPANAECDPYNDYCAETEDCSQYDEDYGPSYCDDVSYTCVCYP
ncbi:unnamed protein product [Zymoseptoria tritici ST99CH_1A5]|uniref:Secreted protein n=3 Tax=Zymoseptoria tritici TaxID=1047171 RepID=A0A1X7S4U1_ZYMT9|nr:unnamed protein product [Zymoseptoria tritici ST99CH_3D7]SMR59143.1 unnamed protein product [Zymoseptoria tritici ST99CH_1E4]SMR62981.1 unnamed protein product [Zymoseptoria tritici ST99CH_3D1]SMY28351.1 unnamed protein product [Zymoseptoria tritici ST99CH_1A5]